MDLNKIYVLLIKHFFLFFAKNERASARGAGVLGRWGAGALGRWGEGASAARALARCKASAASALYMYVYVYIYIYIYITTPVSTPTPCLSNIINLLYDSRIEEITMVWSRIVISI